MNDAFDRGVQVRLIYHGKGDKDTTADAKNAAHLPAANKLARKTSAIFHHKFIVLSGFSNGVRKPRAVLAGSTNFTFNGVYCQANDITLSTDAAVAAKYLDQFEHIFSGETVPDTKARDTNENILDPAAAFQIGFSPRTGQKDLACFTTLIDAAKQDVLFSTAFNMAPNIYESLLGRAHDSILRYGIQDKQSKITGLHADRTADFEATALLPQGLDGWLKEQRVKGQTGNILVHTKVILVDFTTDAPVIISGSHNYSLNASQSNDENYIIARGNTDLADCFGCEVLRIYDMYRFRFKQKSSKTAPHLTPDDSWTKDYYDPNNLKFADRVVFSGATSNEGASANAHPATTAAHSIQRLRAPKPPARKKAVGA